MKKKIISILITLSLLCSLFVFSSCSEKKDTRTPITIASWNLGTEEQNVLNRKMIKAFEEKYPEYRVDIVLSSGENYDLAALAASNKLPDVFMLDRLDVGLTNEWLMDISSLASADEDWAKVPKPVIEATSFNERVFAVPAEMHLQGLYVNDSVFDSKNYDRLEANPEFADFIAAVKSSKLNKVGEYASINNEASMLEWYPAQFNDDFGYYTWDGEKFNLDSIEMQNCMDQMVEIRIGQYSFDSWTQDQKEATAAISALDLFRKQGMAMYFGRSYERLGIVTDGVTGESFEGNLRFIGTPGGRNVIIPDIYGINKYTEHKDIAYKLAKWLSFDPEGILKRLELDTKNEFISLPLTNDEVVVNTYFENESLRGLKDVFESLDKGITEIFKFTPNYNYLRWDMPTNQSYVITNEEGDTETRQNATIGNMYDDIWKGLAPISWADYKITLNEKVNDEYQISVRALNILYPVEE